MSLGSQIKKYRALADWRLEDLSERSGVDVGTISALELRNSKKSQYAGDIAKAFGMTLDQLVDESNTYWPPGTYTTASEPAPGTVPLVRPEISWPFKRISYSRLNALKSKLGRTAGALAISDIDKHLEIVVEKWEREVAHNTGRQSA